MIDDLVIKNGNVFLDGKFNKCNIGIINSKIVNIFDGLNYNSKETIDVNKNYVLPGFIDVHFHVRSPSYPERGTVESETKAAAAGGITSVFEMPISKPCCSTLEIFNKRREHFKKRSYVNYGIYAAPGTVYKQKNRNYEEILERDKDKILAFKKEGAVAFKIFMINPPKGREDEFDGLSITDKGHLYHTLKLIKKTNLVSTIHAESEELLDHYRYVIPKSKIKKPESHNILRPAFVETLAINEILFINKHVNAKLHIAHLSSKEGLDIIDHYRNQGVDVSTETCPHYLFYSKNVLKKYGNFAKINPPIREIIDQKALLEGITRNKIEIVASDHAAFCSKEKLSTEDIDKVPPGHPGVNSIIYSLLNESQKGKISIVDVVKLCSINPAKRFNLYHILGKISIGSNANITIIDDKKTHHYTYNNQFSKAKDSDVLYSNKKFKGKVAYTIVNGSIVYDGFDIVENKAGKFINSNKKSL